MYWNRYYIYLKAKLTLRKIRFNSTDQIFYTSGCEQLVHLRNSFNSTNIFRAKQLSFKSTSPFQSPLTASSRLLSRSTPSALIHQRALGTSEHWEISDELRQESFAKHINVVMPRCACASEVYSSVFVCVSVCPSVCVDCYSCSVIRQVRVSIGF